MRRIAWLISAMTLLGRWVCAFEPRDYVFLLTAQTTAEPSQISISWEQKNAGLITVRRKLVTDHKWGSVIAKLPGDATSFTDSDIQKGVAYEYQFSASLNNTVTIDASDDPSAPVAAGSGPYAFGYICAGVEVPPTQQRGKVILIVDDRFAEDLSVELDTLRKDLIGDGWEVIRHDVSMDAPVADVKQLIKADYAADSQNVRSVFLFGHVPVPYSGLINPDMHAEHLGAWPADVYYGDMDGVWTDETVDKEDAEFDANNNVPGDGKFDQSEIPGAVELEVGRVDMWDMPAFSPQTELALLRNYLRKDHEFRHGILRAPARGLIRDNFGVVEDDAPGADAWRAFPALFGTNGWTEVGVDQFFPTLSRDAYLWAFSCGGGDRNKADGVGWTDDFAQINPKAVFYLLHGSWFGDWNTADNFLRAPLGTFDYGLVSIWSSLPHWFFHHLAMGETIGFATRLVQNNQDGLYRNDPNYSTGQVHISMMGDPTLRVFPLAPPTNLRMTIGDKVSIQWDASADSVTGYYVYRGTNFEGTFEKLNTDPVRESQLEDAPAAGHYVYMVKAVGLQTTGSGMFWNLSQGVFAEFDVAPKIDPIILQPKLSEPGAFEFTANGWPGRDFTVQSRTLDGNWGVCATGVCGDDGVVSYREQIDAARTGAFYRVVWE